MSRQGKNTYKYVSTAKKIVVVAGLFLFFFGGLFMGIVAVSACENYIRPYAFVLSCGVLGLITGLLVARLIKPYVILNITMYRNYAPLTMMFSVGFIGGFMLLAYSINQRISAKACGEFTITNMEHRPARGKIPESYLLYIDINGKTESLRCKHNYWKDVAIGETVEICIYKSPLGFDKLVLMNED